MVTAAGVVGPTQIAQKQQGRMIISFGFIRGVKVALHQSFKLGKALVTQWNSQQSDEAVELPVVIVKTGLPNARGQRMGVQRRAWGNVLEP